MYDKKFSCLIVDDEPPALEVLKKYVQLVQSLEFAGTCADAIEALSFLQQNHVDLLFLDIQMPQLLGTDLIRTLKKPPKVIFTTAFRKFAIEGFELDAVDYLLKPISFERFLKAVNKVMDTSLLPDNNFNSVLKPTNLSEAFISLRCDRKNLKVSLNDILYIESIKDYIKVVLAGRTIITKQSISSIEEMLPKDQFIRIHRSFIVSLNKIETYTADLLGIAKYELPISRSYRIQVDNVLRQKE